jgi:hypothetical protein
LPAHYEGEADERERGRHGSRALQYTEARQYEEDEGGEKPPLKPETAKDLIDPGAAEGLVGLW